AEFVAGVRTERVPMPAVLSARWASRAAEFQAFDEWVHARGDAQGAPGRPMRLREQAGRSAPMMRVLKLAESKDRIRTLDADTATASAAAEVALQNYQSKRPAQAGSAVPTARK